MKHVIACLILIITALILISITLSLAISAYAEGYGPERTIPLSILSIIVGTFGFALLASACVGIWEDVRPLLEKIAGRAL